MLPIRLKTLMPNARDVRELSPSDQERWDAQLHVTSMGERDDPEGWAATITTLTKYGDRAASYFYHPDFGAEGFSLEIMFEPDSVAAEVVHLWNLEANKPKPRRSRKKMRA
jgi:hypothetical protein